MTEAFRRWWPALPALLILWFGGASFVEKYPRPAGAHRGRAAAAGGPDSLLEGFRRELAAGAMGNTEDTLAAAQDPFRPIRPARPEGRTRVAAAPPPPRNFQLNGTVGTEVATLTDNSGRKMIVKVGDVVDSATVLSIEANKVTLKDRAGKFDLLLER